MGNNYNQYPQNQNPSGQYPQVPPANSYPPAGSYPQGGQKPIYNTLKSFGEIQIEERKKLVFELLQVTKPGVAPTVSVHIHEYYLGNNGWRPGKRVSMDNQGRPRSSIVVDIELGKVNEWAALLTRAAQEIAAGAQANAGPQGVGGLPPGPATVPFPPVNPPATPPSGNPYGAPAPTTGPAPVPYGTPPPAPMFPNSAAPTPPGPGGDDPF